MTISPELLRVKEKAYSDFWNEWAEKNQGVLDGLPSEAVTLIESALRKAWDDGFETVMSWVYKQYRIKAAVILGREAHHADE
jgi:hypothetical protein